MHSHHYYMFALLPLALAGCGALYQNEFQCPIPPSAGGCRHLQTVYKQSGSVPPVPPAPDPHWNRSMEADTDWSPPVKTVWITPYLDSAGRRHEASLIRIIVFPGPKATSSEPEFLLPPIPDESDGQLIAPPAGPQSLPSARSETSVRGGASRQPRPSSPSNPVFTPPNPSATPTPASPGFPLPGY